MQFTSIHEAILNSMSEAVYVIDQSMRIQYANPASEQMTGYTFDEAIGRSCDLIFCERSFRCDGACPPKKAMRDREPILHREAETRSKSGELRQTQISISPFYDDGECVGAVIVIKDITELKKAEEQIRAHNRFLSDVINALPHPFTVVDARTYEVRHANKVALAGDIPAGLTCHQLSHHRSEPCGGSDHPCPLTAMKHDKRPAVVEHVHSHPDGTVTDVEVHCYPILDENGELAQMIEYCIDISERKRAAEERERLIADLQRALAEVKTLGGLLPICASCKKIRDDKGYWNTLELYISEHSGAEFSHGICPECAERLYPDYYKRLQK